MGETRIPQPLSQPQLAVQLPTQPAKIPRGQERPFQGKFWRSDSAARRAALPKMRCVATPPHTPRDESVRPRLGAPPTQTEKAVPCALPQLPGSVRWSVPTTRSTLPMRGYRTPARVGIISRSWSKLKSISVSGITAGNELFSGTSCAPSTWDRSFPGLSRHPRPFLGPIHACATAFPRRQQRHPTDLSKRNRPHSGSSAAGGRTSTAGWSACTSTSRSPSR